jgi:hypothetical protein
MSDLLHVSGLRLEGLRGAPSYGLNCRVECSRTVSSSSVASSAFSPGFFEPALQLNGLRTAEPHIDFTVLSDPAECAKNRRGRPTRRHRAAHA